MEEMYAGGEYNSSTTAAEVHDAHLQAAGQLPAAPQGIPADAAGAVSEAMANREQNARTVRLS